MICNALLYSIWYYSMSKYILHVTSYTTISTCCHIERYDMNWILLYSILPILKPSSYAEAGPMHEQQCCVATVPEPGPLPPLYEQGHCLDQWTLFWGQAFSICRRKGEGGGSVSGTYWAWMGWRFLTLPCALLTTALCVSVQTTNWREPINLTIIYVERNQIYGRSGSGGAAESRQEHQDPLQNQGIHIFIHKMSYTISYICFLYHKLHHICLNWYSVLYHSLFDMI